MEYATILNEKARGEADEVRVAGVLNGTNRVAECLETPLLSIEFKRAQYRTASLPKSEPKCGWAADMNSQ